MPQGQQYYPVLVTLTDVHVLWVEADSPDKAVGYVRDDCPLDVSHRHNPTRVWCDWQAEAPADPYDWGLVTEVGGHGYEGTPYDAHVLTHRAYLAGLEQAARRAACTAAGHPIPADATGPLTWADYCGNCGPIDPAARTAVAA